MRAAFMSSQHPVPAFPVDVFPDPLSRFIREASEALPCPMDFVGVPMLALLGTAIGTSRVLEIKPGWLEGPRIFAAVVADPGSKKSPALSLAMQPLTLQQRLLQAAYRTAKEVAHKEGGAQTLVLPQLFTTDATLEALVVLLQQNPRGIVFVRDELAAWVRAMNQYRLGKGADRQHWLSLWNGAPIIVNRKHAKEALILHHPFVCVIGCLPPDVLGELAHERGGGDGFLDRILFAYPNPTQAQWSEVGVRQETLEAYCRVFASLWTLPGSPILPPDYEQPVPLIVSLTPEGKEMFVGCINRLCSELADANFPDHLRGAYAKFEGYLARIALILQMTRFICGEADAEDVDASSVQGAATLIRYFQSHARRVHTQLQSTRQDKRVQQATRWIEAHGGQCTVRELQRHGVAAIKRASEAERLLKDMEDRGLGRVEQRIGLNGRTVNLFVLAQQQCADAEP